MLVIPGSERVKRVDNKKDNLGRHTFSFEYTILQVIQAYRYSEDLLSQSFLGDQQERV